MNCSPAALALFSRCWCLPKKARRGALIYLLCQWLKKKVTTDINWSPDTAIASWTDANGNHTGNLAAFKATADMGSVSFLEIINSGVVSISGLQFLQSLAVFNCFLNSISTLDLSGCASLAVVDCNGNSLTNLNVDGCVSLTFLYCSSNQLTTIDISTCSQIIDLNFNLNNLTTNSVNTVLVDLVNNGQVNGTVSLNQTVATPPSVGPPDGIAAKSTLLATVPPWTVTTD